MSRLFDGVNDEVTWSKGSVVSTGAYTFAVVVRAVADQWQGLLNIEASGGSVIGVERTHNVNPGVFSLIYDNGGGGVNWGPQWEANDNWMFFAVSKSTGINLPRFTSCVVGGTPVHQDGSTNFNTKATATDLIVFGNNGGSDWFNGRMAVCALWNTNLSDGDRASLNNTFTRANWLSKSPSFLVDELDAFATDWAGTSTRQSIVGTTDDASDPAGWATWAEEPEPPPEMQSYLAARRRTVIR